MYSFFPCCTETTQNRDIKTEVRTIPSWLRPVTPLLNMQINMEVHRREEQSFLQLSWTLSDQML